jgi:drug/metabolite transporter (DMT)-like permease
MSRGPGRHGGTYVLLCLPPLFWAGNMVVGRAMRGEIPPVAMTFWRWTIAAVILLPFVARELIEHRRAILRAWKLYSVLGLINIAVFNTLCYAGLRYTTATNAALLNSTVPVFILLISWLALREPLSLRQLAGVLLSLLGVVVIIGHGELGMLVSLRFNAGDVLLLIAMVIWAIYTLLLRWSPLHLSVGASLGAMVLYGLPPLAAMYAVELASGARFTLTAPGAATLAYYGVFPSVLAYLFYNRGVVEIGANRTGVFVHLVPVFGFLLSALFLHEPPRLYHLVGVACVFCGIWLCTAVGRGAVSNSHKATGSSSPERTPR